MEKEHPGLIVYTLDDSSTTSTWRDHPRAIVRRIDAGEIGELVHRNDSPLLVDLTSIDAGRPGELDSFEGDILADPWADFVRKDGLAAKVFPYTPLVYHPALLESRRLLTARELGDLAGIELITSPSFRAVDALYAAAHLFGPPLGSRIGDRSRPGQDFDSFLWYAGFACSVRVSSALPSGHFALKAACREGMLHAMSSDRFLRVFPAGKEQYSFPLPDGDGIYYNLLDVLDTVLSPSAGPAFSAEATARAIQWVQECIDERTSLLL